MKVVIAPDSFKGSLTASEVASIIASKLDHPSIEMPLADGGEGSLSAIIRHRSLTKIKGVFCDPLDRSIDSWYGFDRRKQTAFLELAMTSGITLLNSSELSPLQLNTAGTGQMMQHAIEIGAKHIYLFVGGSATVDGGIGILSALGFQFLDGNGNHLEPIPANLHKIREIVTADFKAQLTILHDVNNLLLGDSGAAKVFGPQKGATLKEMKQLEEGLTNFAMVVERTYGKSPNSIVGGGASGGVAGILGVCLGAKLLHGAPFIMELCALEEVIKEADIVISGEGKIDEQSINGKLLCEVGKLARKYNKPLIAVCGLIEGNKDQLKDQLSIEELFALTTEPVKSAYYMVNGTNELLKLAETVNHYLHKRGN